MAILTINLKSNMYQFVIKFRSSGCTELYPTLEGYDQSAWLNPLTFPGLVFLEHFIYSVLQLSG